MLLPDVNILVYAYRDAAPDHLRYKRWLDALVNGDEPYGLSDVVLGGFLRIVTHPGIFSPPTPISDAIAFADGLRTQP